MKSTFELILLSFSISASVLLAEGFVTTTAPKSRQWIAVHHSPSDRSSVSFLERTKNVDDRPSCVRSSLATEPITRQLTNPLLIWRGLVQRLQNVNEATKWRTAVVAILTTIAANRAALDRHLVLLWTHLTTHDTSLPARIFRTDSYEWCLAVLTFGVCIHGFGYADRVVRKAAERGEHHPWRKYRLQDRYQADQYRRRMLSLPTAAGNEVKPDVDTMVTKNMPPVQQSKWHWKAWVLEFWVYVAPLLVWDITSPRRHRRLAAFGAPTTGQILSHIVGGLILYDILFFVGHWSMHKIPLLYKHVHQKHHFTSEVRACDQVRLSLPEEVFDVGCSIVALNWMGAHPLARTFYNIIIVFLLCELHCGFDFPWSPQNVVPFGIVTGSRRHHYHHRFGRHYYQKFFFTVDRLFGFFQKNDGTLKGDSVKMDPYIPSAWKSA